MARHSKREAISDRPAKRKKRSTVSNVYKESFEVEYIVAHEVVNVRSCRYLVKWKDYPSETNTWEPLENLRDCLESISDYFHKLIYPNLGKNHYKYKIMALKESLKKFTDVEIMNASRKYFTETGHEIPDVDEDRIEYLVNNLALIPTFAQDQTLLNEVKTAYLYKELKEKRREQLLVLKQWERDIQAISTDLATVRVVNSVDLEGPPLNFNYINEYIAGKNVSIPSEPPLGCDCSCCPTKACTETHNGTIAYNEALVKVPRGTPIYECNRACKCDISCPNRVIQRGRTIPLAIYRTNNGCGWGVRTLAKIQKGEFVVEYVGEVITTQEAERRGKYYDKQGCTYLFDLDFNEKDNVPYTVDATFYGNVSHFINHSCNPNLVVYAVWVDCLDPNIPRLGLYASRAIKENEELNFDYLCNPVTKKELSNGNNKTKKIINNENNNNNNNIKRNREENLCKCGASNCRKYLFFN